MVLDPDKPIRSFKAMKRGTTTCPTRSVANSKTKAVAVILTPPSGVTGSPAAKPAKTVRMTKPTISSMTAAPRTI